MNNRGQLVMVGIMVAMLVFVMVVALIPSVKSNVSTARTELNCSAEGLSAGEIGTCIVTDSFLFFFVAASLAAGLAWIGMRRLGVIGGGGN